MNLIKYKKKWIISVCLGLVALIFLAACQNTNSKENEKNAETDTAHSRDTALPVPGAYNDAGRGICRYTGFRSIGR